MQIILINKYGVITKKKLKLNYGKPEVKYKTKSKRFKKKFKKKLRKINPKNG